MVDHGLDLRPAGDHGKAHPHPGAWEIAEIAYFLFDHFAVEEDHGIECLILGGGRNLSLHRQMLEEGPNGRCLQRGRFSPAVESDIASDPSHVCLLCGIGVVLDP